MPKKCVKSNIFLVFPNIQHENQSCCQLATLRPIKLLDGILLMLKHNRNHPCSLNPTHSPYQNAGIMPATLFTTNSRIFSSLTLCQSPIPHQLSAARARRHHDRALRYRLARLVPAMKLQASTGQPCDNQSVKGKAHQYRCGTLAV